VWLTVEYFDGGTDQWGLDYDSVSAPYTPTENVVLQNTGQWKRHTFHLTDAYFGGRESEGADLRLADNGWVDGLANYFGRVWISKSAPDNQAPDLAGLDDLSLMVGQVMDIPIQATDPDADTILLSLGRSLDFATLIDHGDGTGILHLAPTWTDVQHCSYTIRVITSDTGVPDLADAVSLRVKILTHDAFLPIVTQ
jgi:hypothetical protein